jgi:Kef-type K+ transport system membrane component KefB
MAKNSKISRRASALLWLLAVGVVIGVLIAYEQISVLYVLATLSIVALLLVVGFADLEKVGRTDDENAGSEV